MNIAEITKLLVQTYGELVWSPHNDPLSELILTVLSQNTSDRNSRRAFSVLPARFGNWDGVAEADQEEIADAIKTGGLAHVKAPRIKKILNQIILERDSLDLNFLGEMPVDEARAWLLNLPGVGPKTAACVLLFSLGKPVLPVDTHVHRVAKRLGLIDSKVTAEKAHDILGSAVPAEDVYVFHIHMIEHGRRVCKSRQTRCENCVLLKECPSGKLLVGATLENRVKA